VGSLALRAGGGLLAASLMNEHQIVAVVHPKRLFFGEVLFAFTGKRGQLSSPE
jgi:hypothetical protein